MEQLNQYFAVIILGALTVTALAFMVIIVRELWKRETDGSSPFFTWLSKALSESDGSPSSMRLMTFVVTISFATVLSFGFVWTVLYWHDQIAQYADLLMLTILLALGLKKLSKSDESKPLEPAQTLTVPTTQAQP